MDESVDVPKRLDNEIRSLAANTPKPAVWMHPARRRHRRCSPPGNRLTSHCVRNFFEGILCFRDNDRIDLSYD